MTTDFNQWRNNFDADNNGFKTRDEDPSPRMRTKAQANARKRGANKSENTKNATFSTNQLPVNIKNAEGTNTDSFYYVEMENTDRFSDIKKETIHAFPHSNRSDHIETGVRSQTYTHRLEPDLSWERPFPDLKTFEAVRSSPNVGDTPESNQLGSKTDPTRAMCDDKRNHSDTNSLNEEEIRTLPTGTSFTTRHDKSLISISDTDRIHASDTSRASTPGSSRGHKRSPQIGRATASLRHRGLHILHVHKSRQSQALPKRILDEVGATNRPDIQNAFDVMREGETLLMVEHTRWVSRTVNTECRLNSDFMHVTYVRRRCWMPKMRCGRLSHTFDIRDVMMARSGRDGLLRVIETDVPETRCFSIVFANNSRKTMSFLAPSEESAKCWVKGINFIRKKLRTLLPRSKRELYLWEIYKATDTSGDDRVGFFEILEMFRQMGAVTTREKKEALRESFLKHVCAASGLMTFEQFVDFYQETTLRPEIAKIFHKYSADKIYLTARELYKFLQESQREFDVTEKDCLQIVEDYEINEERRANKQMSVYAFVNFIKSPACDVFNRRHDEVYQDMKHPLSHYFIASSHNTYLTGDQLKDPSSTDAYMKALLQGCRCVEIDCWDGPDDDPVIFHGYTLTSKVKFRHAIEVIGKYAFEASNYPLILSVENHCSVSQQEKMAAYMKRIFGSELLTECTIAENEELHLPSPAALQGKILIKGKKLPPPHVGGGDSKQSSDDDVSDEDEAAEMGEVLLGKSEERRISLPRGRHFKKQNAASSQFAIRMRDLEESAMRLYDDDESSRTASAATPSTSNQSSTRSQKAQEKKFKLSKNLSDQVVYCKSTKFKGVEESRSNTSFRHISSFSENKAHRLATQKTQAAIKFHKEHLNRTYPGATRTDSSNYDPQPLWNAGFQVVALNYQTRCDKMAVYDAKFRQNGRCGYILKPEFMISSNDNDVREQNKRMVVSVISGSYLSVKSTSQDSFFQIEMLITGDPKDATRKRTTPVRSQGYNPVWGEEMSFYIKVPSLAMVWFKVLNEDSDVVGQFVLPFTSVSEGYRTVHLCNDLGSPIKNAYLLVNISVKNVTL